jgi:hypothetical protein
MTGVTVGFLVVAGVLILSVLYGLRLMSNRSDTLFREVLLDDAAYAITHDDRITLEAEAVSMASAGWDMPDYADHHAAARATVERYDLVQEMVADLDTAITTVEGWDHD